MKGKWKRSIVIVFAIALVISAGVYSSDHFLKATDGEENNLAAPESGDETAVVAEEAELPEAEENAMTIEQGYFESDLNAGAGTEAITETEAVIAGEEGIAEKPIDGEVQLAEAQPDAAAAESKAASAEGKKETAPAAETALPETTAAAVTAESSKTAQEAAATPVEKKAAATEKSVTVVYDVVGGEYTGVGSQILLTAVLTGYDGLNPSYQWQYSDGGEWKDIDGETSPTYMLNVTKENSTYSWRVSVTD
jgi:hypothetical protein